MNKNKFCNIKTYVDTTYGIVFAILCYYLLFKMGFIQWLKLEPNQFYSKFLGSILTIIIIYCISYYFSIIWHELGHLFFGFKVKLKFLSLNFLSFMLTKNDNKLVIKRSKNNNDFKGACYMYFDEEKKYSKKEIILCFIGGILFNILLIFIFFIILLFSNNIYLDIVCWMFIISNIYLAIYNSIPFELNYLGTTDMFKIICCIKEPEYIKTFDMITKINNLHSNGIAYKDMDRNLFIKKKKFNYQSDIYMASVYIDYIISGQKYDEVIKYIQFVLKEADNLLSQNQINVFKYQLVAISLTNEKYYGVVSEYWDDEFEKYLLSMGRINPYFIYIYYVYHFKFSMDKVKANDALKLFYLYEKKYYDKKSVEKVNKMIDDLRKEE